MFKGCVRSAFCYGAECWALRKDERQLQITEMRMLRKMCGKILREVQHKPKHLNKTSNRQNSLKLKFQLYIQVAKVTSHWYHVIILMAIIFVPV